MRLVVALVAAELVLWNIFTPIFEAADESTYYQHVYWLAHERQLPNLNSPPAQAGVMSYPPTYYLPLIPILLIWDAPSIYDPLSIQLRLDHRAGLRQSVFNFFEHSVAESKLQWNNQQWAVHLMRLVANVWGLGTVVLVYLTAKDFFRDKNRAILAVMFVGFNPMFTHLNSTVTVVNLLIFLASLTWYWLIRWKQLTFKKSMALGLVIGLATITKATGLFLLPIALFRWRHQGKWLRVILVGFGLTSGWWFIRNLVLYDSLLATDKVIATTGTRALIVQQMGIVNYWVGFFTSQWATFWTGYGWSAVYFPKIILRILFIFLVVMGWRAVGSRKQGLSFLMGTVLFWWVMLMAAHARFPTFHAKDLYPMIVPISLIVTAGLLKFSRRRLVYMTVILFLVNVAYLLLDVSPKLFGQVLQQRLWN